MLVFCTKIRTNTKKTLILGENDVINDVYPISINYLIMFYLTSKLHNNRVNTFGFMEGGGGGGAFEAPSPPHPHPPGPGTPKKPRRNRVRSEKIE